jgi:hypothetical protein
MKIKMFVTPSSETIDSAEKRINDWLEKTKMISVKHITQSMDRDEDGEGLLTICVWYSKINPDY